MNMSDKGTLSETLNNHPNLMGVLFAAVLYGSPVIGETLSIGAGHTGP